MLVELRVRDLGVIESVALDLGPGMTALTGETGAGKTLLVDALELLVGGRADPSLVRPGATRGPGRRPLRPSTTTRSSWPAPSPRRGAPGPGSTAGWRRSRPWPRPGPDCSSCTASTPSSRCSTPPAQRRALDAFAGTRPRPPHRGPVRAAGPCRRSSSRSAATTGPGPARPTCCGTNSTRSTPPALHDPNEDDALEAEEDRLSEATAHREAAASALGRPRQR